VHRRVLRTAINTPDAVVILHTVPFRFEFPQAAIDDLCRRIDLTRWPDEADEDDWASGVPSSYLHELVAYWRNTFDWRAAEARLNRFPQFRCALDGLDLHFVHVRSPHAQARPLLLVHGWPGSVLEFFDLIPRLTEPEKFGGRAEDAFHVVAPSLQGYGGSPRGSGMSPRAMGRRFARLMAMLGYDGYVAQGGDWGAFVVNHVAADDAPRCAALHVNMVRTAPPKKLADPMSVVRPHEHAWLDALERHRREGMGYYQQQTTRPRTLAYALTDSPVGWCAWVTEKYHAWSDCERNGVRDLRNAISWDVLLTQISLYWITDTVASSIALYREYACSRDAGEEKSGPVPVPTGVAMYPGEFARAPKAWLEQLYPHLVHWYEAPRGGHFAALEQPQLFAEDLWAFAGTLRAAR
jgi:microsomal epoxide hydrolase